MSIVDCRRQQLLRLDYLLLVGPGHNLDFCGDSMRLLRWWVQGRAGAMACRPLSILSLLDDHGFGGSGQTTAFLTLLRGRLRRGAQARVRFHVGLWLGALAIENHYRVHQHLDLLLLLLLMRLLDVVMVWVGVELGHGAAHLTLLAGRLFHGDWLV